MHQGPSVRPSADAALSDLADAPPADLAGHRQPVSLTKDVGWPVAAAAESPDTRSIGYNERDPIRGQDSVNTFKEILELAVDHDVTRFELCEPASELCF